MEAGVPVSDPPRKKWRRWRRSGPSHVERTLGLIRAKPGLLYVEKVERWNQYARRTQDFAGFVDIIAVFEDVTLGVQVCGPDDHAAHVTKILEHPNFAKLARAAHWRFVVVGWREIAHPFGPPLWTPRFTVVRLPVDRRDQGE